MVKLRIHFSAPSEGIPFHYPHSLSGLFHKWLGENRFHDNQSFYSLGWLQGESKIRENKIWFQDQVTWDIGLPTNELKIRIIDGIDTTRFHLYGMNVLKKEILAKPDFSGRRCRFYANSPILLRKSSGSGKRRHVIYSDDDSDELLTASCRKKAYQMGFMGSARLRMAFDCSYKKANTRLVAIKTGKFRGSVCPVIADGPPSILHAIWVMGAGELTGSGFGALDHPDHQ